MADSYRSHVSSFRDDLRFIWVRKWLVVGVVLVFTLGAFVYANLQTRLYQATAYLMYEQQTSISNALGSNSTDATSVSLQLQSAVSTVNSSPVVEKAQELMSGDGGKGMYVTADIVPPDTNTGSSVSNRIAVSAVGERPAAAAAMATAYAEGIIQVRIEQQKEQLVKAQDAIRAQMEQFTSAESKLSTDYLLLSQRLRDLQVAEATTTGDFTVVQPAYPPSTPFTPKPMRSAMFGFGVGLIVGVALAWLIGQFDTRIRSAREASEILDLPVTAKIPRISREVLRSGQLVSLTASSGHVAESLRVLRSNLDWMRVDGELKSILVTSSQKGEGKTLTICNLAVTLALAGKTVVLVDADLRDPRVHSVFNLANATGLSTVVHGSMELEQAFKQFDLGRYGVTPAVKTRSETKTVEMASLGGGSLQILTSGPLPPNPGEVLASQRMASILQRLAESKADYLLVDAPPLLAIGDAGALAPSVDGVLFVTNLEIVRRPALQDAHDALATLPCRKLGLVVVGERTESSRYRNYGYDYSSQ